MIVRNTDRRLVTDGEYVALYVGTERQWKIALADVAVIGFYTIAVWPGVDDYFCVLVRDSGEWEEFPPGIEGTESVWSAIEQYCGVSLPCLLVGSTEWASEIVWPIELRGQTVLELRPFKWTLLWHNRKRDRLALSEAVCAHLVLLRAVNS